MTNTMWTKLREGKKVVGCWNTLAAPSVTEALACAGFDFLFIDFEHGGFDPARIGTYAAICQARGVTPIVRVPANESWMVLQALDQGALGVICPQLGTAEEVARFTASCRYAPRGNRGFSPFTRAGSFGRSPGHVEASNREVSTMVIIETPAAVENFDAIVGDPGLDVIFFGTYDLSQHYGKAGDVHDPRLLALIKDLTRRGRAAGKKLGGFLAKSPADVAFLRSLDLDLYVYGVDAQLLVDAAAAGVAAFKE